jgi:hypothetical protein
MHSVEEKKKKKKKKKEDNAFHALFQRIEGEIMLFICT